MVYIAADANGVKVRGRRREREQRETGPHAREPSETGVTQIYLVTN